MRISGFAPLRTDPRIHVGLPLRLRFGWRDCEEARVSLVDISEHGLCVHWRAPLRLRMDVKANFESAPDEVKVYRVLWVRQTDAPERGFDIGLQLEAMQPTDGYSAVTLPTDSNN